MIVATKKPHQGSTLLDGIISYWKLDEVSGTTANDELGTYDGTLTGAVVNQTGKIGKAYDFPGDDGDQVNCGDITTPSAGVSIACWMNMNSVGTGVDDRHVFVSKGTAWQGSPWTGTEYYLAFYADRGGGSTLLFAVKVSGTQRAIAGTATSWSTATWYHIAGTWNSSTGALKVYLNGSDDSSGSDTYAGSITTSNEDFLIGRSPGTGARHYSDALIDEVGLWNRELTSTEVSTLYNSGSGLTYPF